MVKNLVSDQVLDPLAKIWVPKLYAISRKTKEPNLRKCQKNLFFWPNFGPFDPNSGHQFFFKNLALSVTRYHGQLSSCTIEKTNSPILRKVSDGQTDRLTDRWKTVIS